MNFNFNWDKVANFLEGVGSIVGAALVVIASFQHGGHPLSGDLGQAGLTSLLAAFGLHHSQTAK